MLATGVEDVLPDIPGLSERWGHSVVHCPYCQGWERAGLALGVLAVDEWAVHEAVHVERFSDDVTLYTNGGSAMTAEQRDLLKARDVAVRGEPLARLEGPGTSLERLVFTDGARPPARPCSAARVPASAATWRPGSAAACSTTGRSRSTSSARPPYLIVRKPVAPHARPARPDKKEANSSELAVKSRNSMRSE